MALAFVVLTADAGRREGETRAERERPERVALFGVDAADWRAIDALVSEGRLPAFARLRRVASCGVLKADLPLLSPIIWTTIATGRQPEDHGVLDFMVDLPGGGQAPVNGGARRAKAIWEIWSDAGRPVLVTGWWATWPPDHVRGLVVSDRATGARWDGRGLGADSVHPPAAWEAVSALLVDPASIAFADLAARFPIGRAEFDRAGRQVDGGAGPFRDRATHVRAALASTRSTRAASTTQVRAVRPDLWAAYYDIVDTVAHLFVKDREHGARAIAAAYAEVDEALDATARALAPDTLLVVVSDHGFMPADAGVREDPADLTSGASAWHRPYGIVAVTTAGALAGRSPPPLVAELGAVSPLDLAPTLLARARLPLADDMPGRVIPALAPSGGTTRVATHGPHRLPKPPAHAGAQGGAELERLRALGYVSSGSPPSSLGRVNLAESLFRRGDAAGAARELEPLVRRDPSNQRAALWLAKALAALGRPNEAVAVYDRLIEVSRRSGVDLDPIVFLAATDLDLVVGRVPAARGRLALVPERLAKTPEVIVATGAVAQAEGRAADAERAYRSALSAAPADLGAAERLVGLWARGRPEASAVTSRLALDFPASAGHQALAGQAALDARRFAEAERFFAAAIALAPDADTARVGLARARVLGGRPREALDAVRDAGDSAERDTIVGAAWSALGEWAPAIAAFERALARTPPTPELLNALGRAQLEAGRPGDAAATLQRSLAIAPDQPAARTLLARARRKN